MLATGGTIPDWVLDFKKTWIKLFLKTFPAQLSVWKRKVTVQKSFPCTSSPLFWFEVFLWKFLNEVGPWGPTEFRNFHKNTEIQKRGEQGQGMIFCTWNLLFHSQIEQELPFLIEGLLSAQDKLVERTQKSAENFLDQCGKVTFFCTW